MYKMIKNIKAQFLNTFYFLKKELKGLFILLLLLVILLLIPPVSRYFSSNQQFPSTSDQLYLDSISQQLLLQSLNDSSGKIDPNRLSYFQWLDFGISSDLANAILRKKRKQKQFNCLDELKAVKGVNSSELVNHFKNFSLPSHCVRPVVKVIHIEINAASKKELSKLKGINYKIASRIINYRNKLGGYYSLAQIKEIHNLTNTTFTALATLTVNKYLIKKINLNKVSKYKLKKHPYLTAKQASTIVNYRKKITRYDNLEQFKKVYGITSHDIKRLKPYLSFH